jgi:hypothetical protein
LKDNRAHESGKMIGTLSRGETTGTVLLDNRGEDWIAPQQQAARTRVISRRHSGDHITNRAATPGPSLKYARETGQMAISRACFRTAILPAGSTKRCDLVFVPVGRHLVTAGSVLVTAGWGTASIIRRVRRSTTQLLTTPPVARDAALTAGVPRLFTGPLVRGALLVRGLAALTCDFPLLDPIHRCKSAILLPSPWLCRLLEPLSG